MHSWQTAECSSGTSCLPRGESRGPGVQPTRRFVHRRTSTHRRVPFGESCEEFLGDRPEGLPSRCGVRAPRLWGLCRRERRRNQQLEVGEACCTPPPTLAWPTGEAASRQHLVGLRAPPDTEQCGVPGGRVGSILDCTHYLYRLTFGSRRSVGNGADRGCALMICTR